MKIWGECQISAKMLRVLKLGQTLNKIRSALDLIRRDLLTKRHWTTLKTHFLANRKGHWMNLKDVFLWMDSKDLFQNIIASKCISTDIVIPTIEFFTQLGYFHFLRLFSFESDGLLNMFSRIAKLHGASWDASYWILSVKVCQNLI